MLGWFKCSVLQQQQKFLLYFAKQVAVQIFMHVWMESVVIAFYTSEEQKNKWFYCLLIVFSLYLYDDWHWY